MLSYSAWLLSPPARAGVVFSYHVFCRTPTRPSVADLVALRGEGEAVAFQVVFGGVTPKQHIWLSTFTYKQAKKIHIFFRLTQYNIISPRQRSILLNTFYL